MDHATVVLIVLLVEDTGASCAIALKALANVLELSSRVGLFSMCVAMRAGKVDERLLQVWKVRAAGDTTQG